MKNGWETRQLGEVAELRGRIGWRGLTAKEYTQTGPLFLSVHSLNYGDYVDFRDAFHVSEDRYKESPEIMLQKDDVLICKDGAGIGKVGIVGKLPAHTTINSSLLLIRSSRKILPKFLYHCLASPYFQTIVNSRLNGATTPHLYQRDITEFPIVLPPIEEQKRIVCILDEAFQGIAVAKANAEKNLQNADELFGSTLDAMMTSPSATTESSVADLASEGLILKPFDGNHGEIHPKKSDYSPTGVPFVMASDLKNGGVDTENCTFIPRELADNLRVGFAKDGDVLISHKGTIGRTAIAETQEDYIMLTPQVTGYRILDLSRMDRRYLRYFFMSPYFQRQMISGAADGSTRAYIGITKQLSLRIRYPSISRQKEVVETLVTVEAESQKLRQLQQQKLTALDELKKSLLHRAFTGKLQVTGK